jgi:hypothetical protein
MQRSGWATFPRIPSKGSLVLFVVYRNQLRNTRPNAF